jgi:uncharacterized protein
MHTTPEGFLLCVGVPIARTGEMVYGPGETPLEADEDGQVTISREEKDVFNPKTMASFEGKPVTITHPTEFVNPDNWSQLAKGVVQNVRRGIGDSKNDLIADLLITDSVAINLIKNGLREVSCGYEASYQQDEIGEGKQTRIIGNHLALVDQGRAGSSYAINDHKGKGREKMKLSEKIKSIFAKAQDEAMKMAEDESGEMEKKKDDSKDAGAYDELVQICKDLSSKIDALSGAKDADQSAEEKPAAEAEKKDDSKDAEVDSSVEDRLKALEASVAKILESMSTEDADEGEEGMEAEDDDMEENTMTGDAVSRIEILAPGMKTNVKDAKAKALKSAYATKEGKQVIDSLTGGKPTFDSAEKVETLFIAASEVLKASRTSDLSKTKSFSSTQDSSSSRPEVMTADKMNELNNKFYNRA